MANNFVSFPDGFYSPIKKKVRLMKADKTCPVIGDIEIYSTEAIYTCTICLMSTSNIK